MPTLFLCGDVMTGRGIDQILAYPCPPVIQEPYVRDARDYVALAEEANGRIAHPVAPGYIWGDALAELERVAPDARIINLETSITTCDDFWPGKGIHYRMHPRNVDCLTAAAVDVCVLANNHVLDYGRAGLDETIATLIEAGLKITGAGALIREAREPAIVDLSANGRILVFAVGTENSGIPRTWAASAASSGVDLLPDLSDATADDLLNRVRGRKRQGDVAVVSIHWGDNWGYEVPDAHVRFAHRLLDGGVDLIHGHSSHHPRPVEIYRLVLYGCGDFITRTRRHPRCFSGAIGGLICPKRQQLNAHERPSEPDARRPRRQARLSAKRCTTSARASMGPGPRSRRSRSASRRRDGPASTSRPHRRRPSPPPSGAQSTRAAPPDVERAPRLGARAPSAAH